MLRHMRRQLPYVRTFCTSAQHAGPSVYTKACAKLGCSDKDIDILLTCLTVQGFCTLAYCFE